MHKSASLLACAQKLALLYAFLDSEIFLKRPSRLFIWIDDPVNNNCLIYNFQQNYHEMLERHQEMCSIWIKWSMTVIHLLSEVLILFHPTNVLLSECVQGVGTSANNPFIYVERCKRSPLIITRWIIISDIRRLAIPNLTRPAMCMWGTVITINNFSMLLVSNCFYLICIYSMQLRWNLKFPASAAGTVENFCTIHAHIHQVPSKLRASAASYRYFITILIYSLIYLLLTSVKFICVLSLRWQWIVAAGNGYTFFGEIACQRGARRTTSSLQFPLFRCIKLMHCKFHNINLKSRFV